jgi:hypothetical protein
MRLPDAALPSPHEDTQHHGQRQEAAETEPSLGAVQVGHDRLDLVREEVRQPEQQRDSDDGGARVRHHELPERDARAARDQKRGGAQSARTPRRSGASRSSGPDSRGRSAYDHDLIDE